MMLALIRSTVQIQARLREHGIASAVIGGLAVAVWGEPRLTRDCEDAVGIIRRQSDKLDQAYILNWLQQFEAALDDPTLIHALGLLVHGE